MTNYCTDWNKFLNITYAQMCFLMSIFINLFIKSDLKPYTDQKQKTCEFNIVIKK